MRIALLFTLALVCAMNAEAQQKPELNVVIEKMDSEAAACGISEGNVRSIAQLVLRSNGIQVSDAARGNHLYINTTFLELKSNSHCVYGLTVQILGYTPSDLTKRPLNGFTSKNRVTELCLNQSISIHPKYNLSTELLKRVETLIKFCLGDMVY